MKSVRIVEVGLRDGLQNESSQLSIGQRFELVTKLIEAGVTYFEVGAFVSSKWVPQMAQSAQLTNAVLKEIVAQKASKKLFPSVLVPNELGMLQAIETGIREVAIFAACTESFSQKNINCSIDESFERFVPVMKLAKKNKIKVRGYLSTCFGCPFEGAVDENKVVQLVKRMSELGVYEVSIGDTIGVAHAGQIKSLFKKLKKVISIEKLAGHFHDTRGQALANILAAFDVGVEVFDSSIGGLGGCPYAPGAAGNVATEDVAYLFQDLNVSTNLNLEKLIEVHHWLQPLIDHPLSSKVGRVGILKPLNFK